MLRHQLVAIAWTLLNIGLAALGPFVDGKVPWLPVAVVASVPLLMILFAEPIAENLHWGFMNSFASDRDQPQSPLVIMFLGWIAFFLQTVFLLSRL